MLGTVRANQDRISPLSAQNGEMAGPTERLLRLLSTFQGGGTWSGPELADHLGVTVRTVRRDVERLRDLGYTVDADSGRVGGYGLGRGGRSVPPLILDDEEALILAACLRAAGATRRSGAWLRQSGSSVASSSCCRREPATRWRPSRPPRCGWHPG